MNAAPSNVEPPRSPLAAAKRRRRGNVSGEIEQQRQRQVGDSLRILTGSRDDGDPEPARGGEINVHRAAARKARQRQLRRGRRGRRQ